MQVIASSLYERRVKRLLTAETRESAEGAILAQPDAWPVIPGTGGARKARVALPGRGKRGGARLIYFFSAAPGLVALLDIYAKNAKENLTSADKQELRGAIAEIVAALQSDDPAGQESREGGAGGGGASSR